MDTGAWLAFLDRADQHHDEAVRLFLEARRQARPFVTSNLVLAETFKLVLYRRGPRMAGEVMRRVLGAERLRLCFAGAEHHVRALEHLAAHPTARLTYEDATSFAIMESERIREVLGFDDDFRLAGFRLAWEG